MYLKVLYMTQRQVQLAVLQDICNIMDCSARFISLSGLSGIFAHFCALAGAGASKWYFYKHYLLYHDVYHHYLPTGVVVFLAVAAVLVLTITSVIYFSDRKVQKIKQLIWSSQGKRLVIN